MQQRSVIQTQCSKFENKDNAMVTDNDNNNINYFLPGLISDNEKRVSAGIIQQLQNEFTCI